MLKMTLTGVLLVTTGVLAANPASAQSMRNDFRRGDGQWHQQSGQQIARDAYEQDRDRREQEARDEQRRENRQDNQRTVRQNPYNPAWNNWRDRRPQSQWDNQYHNGYYLGNTWYRGQPPRSAVRRRDYNPGYRPWARGARLDRASAGRFVEVDYRARRLREPPRGYRWVEDDRGDYLLAAVIGGLIAEVILNPSR
jgi:Ni/Co efflux regulator RcnB